MTGSWARRWGRLPLVLLLLSLLVGASPALAGTVKVGVLKFGTVNWTLDVVKTHGLDVAEGVELEILPLAGKNATSVALQAGEVDIIVTDWIWVTRQRAEGAGFSFVPYSAALGAVVVPADSPVRAPDELDGKRLGIAGGPLDKSWLLLRAMAAEQAALDLDNSVEKVFGAPPLLSEQLKAGRLDAVLTFWHYAARLEAAGYRRLIGVDEIVGKLGLSSQIPLVGYAFDETWAKANKQDLEGFLRAAKGAMARLGESDEEWQRIRPLMKVQDEASFVALREGYRAGIPQAWDTAAREDAARLFSILAKLGGKQLVGSADVLQDGTFWPTAGD